MKRSHRPVHGPTGRRTRARRRGGPTIFVAAATGIVCGGEWIERVRAARGRPDRAEYPGAAAGWADNFCPGRDRNCMRGGSGSNGFVRPVDGPTGRSIRARRRGGPTIFVAVATGIVCGGDGVGTGSRAVAAASGNGRPWRCASEGRAAVRVVSGIGGWGGRRGRGPPLTRRAVCQGSGPWAEAHGQHGWPLRGRDEPNGTGVRSNRVVVTSCWRRGGGVRVPPCRC